MLRFHMDEKVKGMQPGFQKQAHSTLVHCRWRTGASQSILV